MSGILKGSKDSMKTLDWNEMCKPVLSYKSTYAKKDAWLNEGRHEFFDDLRKLSELYKSGQIEKNVLIGIVGGMIAVLVEKEVERGIENYFEVYLHSLICSKVINVIDKDYTAHRK